MPSSNVKKRRRRKTLTDLMREAMASLESENVGLAQIADDVISEGEDESTPGTDQPDMFIRPGAGLPPPDKPSTTRYTSGYNVEQNPVQPGTEPGTKTTDSSEKSNVSGTGSYQKNRLLPTNTVQLVPVPGTNATVPGTTTPSDAVRESAHRLPSLAVIHPESRQSSPEANLAEGLYQVPGRLYQILSGIVPDSLVPGSGFDSDDHRAVKLPYSTQQIDILKYLASVQLTSGLDRTPMLLVKSIATETNYPQNSVRIQIKRLIKKGFLQRVAYRCGNSKRSGTSYRVPGFVIDLLREKIDPTEWLAIAKNQVQESPAAGVVSSSIKLKNTTTNKQTERVMAESLKAVIDRLGLADYGLGANDVLAVWRSGVFDSLEDLDKSLEHLAFYLGSEHAKSIKHPKAWALAQLKRGYYPEPAGFRSTEEIQEEERLRDARKRLERLEAIRREVFDTEFAIWLKELPEARIKALTSGLDPSGQAARAVLRARFAEERGLEVPQDER